MNAAARKLYFTQVWPAAAAALGCARGDDAARRAVTREAMRLVGGPATDSTSALGPAEVTALFTYCRHLAAPEDLRLLSAWMSCQEDYKTFNAVRQGDWWRERAGYKRQGRIDRQRFGGRPAGGLFNESALSPEEARQYLMTMRARARGKDKASPPRPRRATPAAAAAPAVAADDNCPF